MSADKIEPGGVVNGKWMKRGRWKVSHFVRDDMRTHWMGEVTGRGACGVTVAINENLEYEPTGIDTCDRCERCRAKVGGAQ